MRCALGLRSGWFLGALFAAACLATPASAFDRIKVVASFSILGDLVKNIGGEHVEVADLVGPPYDAFMCGSIKYKPYFQLAISSYADELTLSVNLFGSPSDRDRILSFFDAIEAELPN
jgi:NRPS condensation-like uncharacterized protein